jgi:hypothetical protein
MAEFNLQSTVVAPKPSLLALMPGMMEILIIAVSDQSTGMRLDQ